MGDTIATGVSTIAALIAVVGGFATMMLVIFRTGKRLGEAENKIDNLELKAKAAHDGLQDARTEELARDVQHIQISELVSIREALRDLKLEIKEQEDDLEKKIDDLRNELDRREDDLERRIEELKLLISEKEDDLEKRVDNLQLQFREDIRENRSDIKSLEDDLKRTSRDIYD